VVPVHTVLVIFATLVSQITLLLAFLLPLKVIILLGSNSMPGYLPQSWQELGRENLVIFLAVSAVGFYLLHLMAEKMVGIWAEQGAVRLIERSRKIYLFKNQDRVALLAYQRFSQTLAGVVFIGLALFSIGVIYPDLAMIIIGFGFTSYVMLSLVFERSRKFRNSASENISSLMKVLGAVGFLIAFAFMVADFLKDRPPGFIVAIVSLLLVRQLMNRLAGVVADLSSLFSRRHQINALFFHGKNLEATVPRHELDYWGLLEMPRRAEWIREMLSSLVGVEPGSINCVWQQTGIANVVAFEVEACNQGEGGLGHYFVKLFNNNKSALAQHEASLFSEYAPVRLPSLQFLGTDQIGIYHCNLFGWERTHKFSAEDLGAKREEVASRLISCEPPAALVERYERSRPLLGQRISLDMVKHLRLAASGIQQTNQLNMLERDFEQLRLRLQSLPVQIVNPDMQPDLFICARDGDVRLTHWGRWSLEPVGAGWPVPGRTVSEKDLVRLSEVLAEAREHRKALTSIDDADVRLAALVFSMENFYNRQRYVNALDLLPAVIGCLDCTSHGL